MPDTDLNEYTTATLDGTGSATVQLGPLTAYETWLPSTAAVSVSTNTQEAQCQVYLGDQPIQANFIANTLSGSTGDTTGLPGNPLKTGQYVWAVWTGGDAGSIATLKVIGTRRLAESGHRVS